MLGSELASETCSSSLLVNWVAEFCVTGEGKSHFFSEIYQQSLSLVFSSLVLDSFITHTPFLLHS